MRNIPRSLDEEVRKHIPEENLMIAVLEQAIADYRTFYNKKNRTEFWSVKDWFESTDITYTFSFYNVCAILKLDPLYIWDGVKRNGGKKTADWVGRRPMRPLKYHQAIALCRN